MLYYALFVVKGKQMDVKDDYIKIVNRLIDRFEFLRRGGIYFIPCARALQTSGNPAAGKGGNTPKGGKTPLVILCDDDADRDGAAGKLLADILNAMKFPPEEVYVISGVKSASSGKGDNTLLNELSKLSPKVIVAFGKTSANALAGNGGNTPLAPSKDAPFSDWKGATKVLLVPCLEEMLENKDLKRKAWVDLQAVMKEFGKTPA